MQQANFEVQETILNQLKASKVNGFPFFAYTGIKSFTMEGEDTLMLKNIPSNPNGITNVVIVYDYGRDSYRVHTFKKNQRTIPSNSYEDIYFDALSSIIVDEMGVNWIEPNRRKRMY